MASGQPPGTDPLQPWTQQPPLQAPAHGAGYRGSVSSPQEGERPSGQPMALSDEERAVMKECESESFFKRALPFSIGSMVAAQMLVKSGRWQPNPKYGALPKAMVAGAFGYFLGKISYLPVCQEKIMRKIPHTNLAAAVRKSRGIPEPDDQAPTGWESAPSESKLRDEYSSSSSAPALDDRFRPSVDREVKVEDVPEEESKPKTSYEELRRRNRQEYEDNLHRRSTSPRAPGPSYKDNPLMPQKPWPEGDKDSSTQEPPPPPEQPQKRKRTNIWGDVIEN